MTNVAHASLTGTQLHEPKGADTAALGTVYVANGAGSGSWSSVGTSSFTGMIADFPAPVAPSGWLELDGSTISTSTYSALYAVMSIQTSCSRTNGSPVLTSIPDTSNIKAGYYVFGTGIASGTTVTSVDSASQITISNNASSSGTASLAVSPWLLNTGTIVLPDLKTAGRFRRSRTASTSVGQVQASQVLAHTHTGSGTTGNNSVGHTHTYSGVTGVENQSHTHNYSVPNGNSSTGGGAFPCANITTLTTTGTENENHNHNYSGTTASNNVNHTHPITFTTDSTGTTESRPVSIVVMTCVKT